MLALTIWEPYATLIALGFKPLENRDWQPPKSAMNQLIAIHSAKRPMDEDAVFECAKQIGWDLKQLYDACVPNFGKVVSVGRLVDVVTDVNLAGEDLEIPADLEPWFVGRWGWVFREMQKLRDPVPVRGFQKLWKLPNDAYEKVQSQLQLTLPAVAS